MLQAAQFVKLHSDNSIFIIYITCWIFVSYRLLRNVLYATTITVQHMQVVREKKLPLKRMPCCMIHETTHRFVRHDTRLKK